MRLSIALASSALALLGCGPASPPPPPLSVWFGGCASVWEDGTCERDGPVVLWVEDAALVDHIAVDGQPQALSAEPAAGGARWSVSVSPGARSLQVVPIDPQAASAWTLPLAEPVSSPELASLQSLEIEDLDRALAHADALLATDLPDVVAARVRSRRARLLMRLGRTDEAISALTASAPLHLAAGRPDDALWDVSLASYLHVKSGRLAEARALEPFPPVPASSLDQVYQLSYARGLVATLAGDYRTALREMERAAVMMERKGEPQAAYWARSRVADTLLRLGRWDEAIAQHASALEPAVDTPCFGARVRSNLGWARFLAAERGHAVDLAQAVGELDEALAAFASCNGYEADRAQAALHRGLVALFLGDLDAAAAALGSCRAAADGLSSEARLWLLEAEARLAAAQGEPARAVALRGTQLAAAQQSLSLEMEWRAMVGLAEGRRDRGDADGALQAWAEARSLFRAHAALAPAHEGREGFLGGWERAVAGEVGLLLALGREAEAFATVRRFRASYLRSQVAADPGAADWEPIREEYARLRQHAAALAQGSWALSADEHAARQRERADLLADAQRFLDAQMGATATADQPLRPPRPGELLLAWMPLGDTVVAFAAAPGSLQVRTFDARAEPSSWLAALGPALRAAQRVTLLPAGALRAVDFGALPFDGEPLALARPLAIGLDLPARPPRSEAPRRAVVLADPAGDLPGARQEADEVARALEAAGLSVQAQVGAQVSREAVVSALADADLVHYAGHGRADDAAWMSALVLAEGVQFTAADALASPRAPRAVVLSSCETAQTADSAVEGLGVAQAFVLAGADAVVGAVEPVPDEVARTFSTSLYSAPLDVGWPAAFHSALRATAQAHPGQPATGAFRLLLP